MYCITATMKKNGVAKQIPTFLLHEDIQGITNEKHAEQIAMEIIGECIGSTEVSILAVKCD